MRGTESPLGSAIVYMSRRGLRGFRCRQFSEALIREALIREAPVCEETFCEALSRREERRGKTLGNE